MIQITLQLTEESGEIYPEIMQMWDKVSAISSVRSDTPEHEFLKTKLTYAVKDFMSDRYGLKGKFNLDLFKIELV